MTQFNWQVMSESPQKLRTFLMGQGITRTLLKQIKFHGGQIEVNGQPELTNFMVRQGDKVMVVLPAEPGNDHVPVDNDPIDIVYEDANFLIVNKPAGVASVPSHIYGHNSLVNRVKGYYVRQGYANQKVHIVTRLDRDTSGLVIFAKHHMAHSVLDKQLKDHSIQKDYLALTAGTIQSDHAEIDLPIGRTDDSFVKRQVTDNGKMARTEFWLIKQWRHFNLVRVRLHTGRTHQIRVHFTFLKHPLLGDWLYNPDDYRMKRQALHCYQVRFYDPFNQKVIECQTALPVDMQAIIQRAD